tara:strand:+ start:376 stop:2064 length:1689 start_codon:yes stop_codon:yes gene_type:complete
MIPGSNQSPSDIETMVMVLNDAGDCFVEQYKPIEEVRAVALQRLDAMCLRTKQWHYPDNNIQVECEEFIKGSRLMSDAAMIEGDTIEEKAIAAFKELEKPEKRAEWDRNRDEMIAAINAETDAARMLEIASDEQRYMSFTVDESECFECQTFLNGLPTGAKVRAVFDHLGANCGSDALRKLVTKLGRETATTETQYSGALGDTLQLARPDMIDVAGVEDHQTTPIEKIAHEIHNLWVPIDRSGTLPSPLKFTAPTIPSVGNFNQVFSDVADARGAALWAENKKLALFWSGGIDSTVALVALLKTVPDDRLGDLTVHFNAASIAEYPEFYSDHIKDKVSVSTIPSVVKPTDRFWAENVFASTATEEIAKALKTSLVVTGELGDQCFGSAGFANDPDKIAKSLDAYLSEDKFSSVRDEIDTLNAACPIPVNSVTTMMWWWNFALKWSEVRFRSLTAVTDSADFDNVRHFFDTDDFQRWSISNDDLKIKDTIQSYKFTAKDYIHAYAGHDDYRDEKLKVGSLRVRWGAPLGIDSNNTVIRAGDTSTDLGLIKERYGDKLLRFVEK